MITTQITLIAKKAFNLNGTKGWSYAGYPEEPIDGKKYIVFSTRKTEYEVFPEARAGKKYDANQSCEVTLYEHFDMFSGKTKLRDWEPVED